MGMPVITQSDGTREQAVTDIVTSVALEQAAISHILNAGGEELQLAVANSSTNQELIDINDSIINLIGTSTKLEEVLLTKLQTVLCDCVIVE